MEFVSDGKKYRFGGEYRKPTEGEWFLNKGGCITQCKIPVHDIRAIVTPVPDKVVVGGIEWEIVNERVPVKGEWYRDTEGNPRLSTGFEACVRPIVRPVRIL